MSSAALSIALANMTYACLGVGLAAMLGVFRLRGERYADALVGLPLGVAAFMLLSAWGALLGVALTPTLVTLIAGAVAAAGGMWLYRRREIRTARAEGSALGFVAGAVPALAIAWVLVAAAGTSAAKPVKEWDGWVLWATKARVLFEHPADGASILRSDFYGAPSYPLGLPALEATTMRAVGYFDGSLVDLQLLALVGAAIVGIWVMLLRVAHPFVIGAALLATLASSQVAYQLTTNYADVPLAFLTASGVVAGAVWLTDRSERHWLLGCFVVFLAAAAWTKNEGVLFGAAACVALVVGALFSERGVRHALVGVLGYAALAAPWQVYTAAYDLSTQDYDLRDLFDPGLLQERADRVWPAARELLQEMTEQAWGATVVVIALSVAVAFLTRRRPAGAYAAAFLPLAFAGLVATYWISNHRLDNDLENSSYRTIVTLLVTGLCLVPLLLADALDRVAGSLATLRARWLSTLLAARRPPAES